MRIGVPREIKAEEKRVALTPAGASALVAHGHEVLLERGAGVGSGLPDARYVDAGARIVDGADRLWTDAELVLKVKEPVGPEIARLRRGLVLFTYLHLAAYPELAGALLETGATAVAYETVQLADGHLPLLAPMSRIAGRMAMQAAAHYLEAPQGGKGVLAGGIPGVARARVTVLGAGVSGWHAIDVAVGMGAAVTVLDIACRVSRPATTANNA